MEIGWPCRPFRPVPGLGSAPAAAAAQQAHPGRHWLSVWQRDASGLPSDPGACRRGTRKTYSMILCDAQRVLANKTEVVFEHLKTIIYPENAFESRKLPKKTKVKALANWWQEEQFSNLEKRSRLCGRRTFIHEEVSQKRFCGKPGPRWRGGQEGRGVELRGSRGGG